MFIGVAKFVNQKSCAPENGNVTILKQRRPVYAFFRKFGEHSSHGDGKFKVEKKDPCLGASCKKNKRCWGVATVD